MWPIYQTVSCNLIRLLIHQCTTDMQSVPIAHIWMQSMSLLVHKNAFSFAVKPRHDQYQQMTSKYSLSKTLFISIFSLPCLPFSESASQLGNKIQQPTYTSAREACDAYTKIARPHFNDFVIGGTEAEQGEFPHMVSLKRNRPSEICSRRKKNPASTMNYSLL